MIYGDRAEEHMDDKTQTGEADRSRINVNEDYELAYWTRTLEVPEDELRNAVRQVGTSVEAVKKYLGRPAA
jgi:hypothetical protein